MDISKIPLSLTRWAGDCLYLSGQLGLKDGALVPGGIAEQTEQTIANIEALLQGEGLGLSDVVKATVWITEQGDFAAFNEVYGKSFAAPYPTRSTVVSGLALPGAKVEIEVMARRAA